MGSGFLVLGPLLSRSYGAWAPAVMALLCLVAYVISVAYYLNLFGAFGLNLFNPTSVRGPKLLTSAVYVLIGLVGVTQGFRALELMERMSVKLKLAIIAGLP